MTALDVDQPLPGMPTTATIYRYEVPVDDRWHTLRLSGPIVHVAARQLDVVEVWALATGNPEHESQFRAFGTGHPLPAERIRHVGTALTASGRLVWHLFERNWPSVVVLDGTN